MYGTGKIKREEFQMFADVGTSSESPIWEIIGSGVEDMSLSLNPNVTTVTDVLGETVTALDKYEKQTDVSPMRAKRESKFFAILYDIVKNEKTLTDVERTFLCVNIFDSTVVEAATEGDEDTVTYAAWTQKAVIAVQSYGGNTEGLDIPFNLHWFGEKTHGAFDPATKTFTADI